MDDAVKPKSKRHCCVPHCSKDERYYDGLSFHRFPTDNGLRKEWVVKIRRDEGPSFKITSDTVVCSQHFISDDFKWTPNRRTLKTGAIPSRFKWSKDVNPRNAPIRHHVPVPEKKKPKLDVNLDDCDDNNKENISPRTKTFQELEAKLEVMNHENQKLKDEVKEKDEKISTLTERIEIERFGVERFSSNGAIFMFYTGFTTLSIFYAFFDYIKPAAASMTSYYYKVSNNLNISLTGRQRNMLLIDEFFMFLCRVKCGLLEEDLSVRFHCHASTVSRKLITWANFLYFVLGSINIWPSRKHIDFQMPKLFKNLFPRTRVIIDCTEIKVEKPSSLVINSKCYSSYKSSPTFKGLIGIAPHGAVIFISSLFTGCISDVEITRLCGLVELLEDGDSIMADKGFVLKNVLEGTGITVNMPPFLMDRGQFSPNQIEETQTIAKLRIHVERHIRRVKEYHIFDGVIPLSTVGTINQIWTIVNMLTLFRGPLVKSWSN